LVRRHAWRVTEWPQNLVTVYDSIVPLLTFLQSPLSPFLP